MNIKQILKYALPLAIAGGLLWYSYKDQDLKAMWADIESAHWYWILISIIPMMLSHYFRSERWRLLLQPTGHMPSSSQTFLAVLSGYFANLILPRMGEVTRCGVLLRNEKIPMDISVGTVFVERVFDVVMLGLITGLSFALEYDRLFAFFTGKLNLKKSSAIVLDGSQTESNYTSYYGLVVIILLAIGCYLVYTYQERLLKIAVVLRIKNFAKGMLRGVLSIFRMQRPILFLVYSVGMWLMYYIATYMGLKALDGTANLGMMAALIVLVVGSFGMIAPVQGGIGAYHYMVSAGLMELYMVSSRYAKASAALMHTSQTLFLLLVGGLAFLYAMVLTPKTTDDAHSTDLVA